MLKFDFSNYMSKYIDNNRIKSYLNSKNKYLNKLKTDKMAGWFNDRISIPTINKVKELASEINSSKRILLVIAIGGSYMGSNAINKIFASSFIPSKVIYIGNSLSSKELNDTLLYL